MRLILLILGGFLLGGVPFSLLLPKWILKKDICALSPDHNPGAGNVFALCGIPMGFACLLLDLGKGFLPIVWAARQLSMQSPVFALVLAAPVLGHAIGPFNGFLGGKCIATSFGVLLGLLPECYASFVLAGCYIFFSIALVIRPHARRSVAAFGAFALITVPWLLIQHRAALALGCLLVAGTAIWKHWGEALAGGTTTLP